MPLGRPARRIIPAILTLPLALAATAGCNTLPWSSRVPAEADVKTHIEGDRARTSPSEGSREVSPTTGRREAPVPGEEISPLPPAIERPAEITAPPIEPAAPPLLDEALARADARTLDLVDALAKEDAPRADPIPTAAPPGPFAVEPPKPAEPQPAPAAAPVPTPPVEPPPAKAPELKPKSPEETWREGIEQLRSVARERVKEATPDAPPGTTNWAVRERLLAWLSEPDLDPDARSAGEIAQGQAVFKGLAAVLDPSTPATFRAAEIRGAVTALEAGAPLEIAELRLCRTVHGFGNVEPLEPSTRKPGQSVVLYSEIDGLAYEPAGPAFRSRVDGKVELILEGSSSPAWTHTLPTVEDACRKRRRDYFIGHKFTLPDDLPPGTYRLRLTQKDLVADHVATQETMIAIVK
jgi:hypothetical protein